MNRIAVDIGGTFTDIICIDESTMQISVGKVRSIPKNLGHGVLQAINKIGVYISSISIFIHGTTTGLNTLLQKKGSKVGLITTEGFIDILEMGRGDRKELYNYLWKKPKVLIPRYLRKGVNERIDHSGQVLKKLDYEEVKRVVHQLIENGVETIAVCLIHSYVNPEHELKIGDIIKEIWPNVTISLSSKVAREFREFERTSTTVIDAYIKKPVAVYLSNLNDELNNAGFTGQFLIVTPNGVISVDTAKEETLRTVASGPIGGAAGAAHLAGLLGLEDVLTLDIGGTSSDVSIIKSGVNIERHESELLGYPVLNPGVDVRSTGAGGGSIARIDVGGILTVGPESAGGDPGPICYGLGGKEPTVTDAAVVNGLIDPEYFVGGEISLDIESAKRGIENIAKQLGLTLNEAADGILRVATDNITNIVSEILVGQGYDPRSFAIISFGGAGGIFVGSIAKNMGISRIIVPKNTGVFSAYGMLTMNFVHSFVQSYIDSINEIDIRKLEKMWESMEDNGIKLLQNEGIAKVDIDIFRSIDMYYDGQGHYVEVPVVNDRLNDDSKIEIARSFHQLHEIKYGHRIDTTIMTANVRLRVVGKIKKVPEITIKKDSNIPLSAIKSKRLIYLDGNFFECSIFERDELLCGNTIVGPAIIEEPLHTLVVSQDQYLVVDEFGNLILNKGGI